MFHIKPERPYSNSKPEQFCFSQELIIMCLTTQKRVPWICHNFDTTTSRLKRGRYQSLEDPNCIVEQSLHRTLKPSRYTIHHVLIPAKSILTVFAPGGGAHLPPPSSILGYVTLLTGGSNWPFRCLVGPKNVTLLTGGSNWPPLV